MSSPSCPNSNQLSAYSHGQLTVIEAEQIAEHVEHCPACEETVRHLERKGDTLIGLLRTPQPADPHLSEPECERSLSALRTWDPRTSTGSAGLPGRSASIVAGLQIRDYELLEKLGEGGMGAVYKARHQKLKRLVALKVLPTEKLDDAAVARFEREMEAAGKVRHENIVAATDAGEHQGTHFLVMEYIAGIDVSRLVKELGPLNVADACEIVRQAARGLACAHQHGLVHRDIKPSNLILSADQFPQPVVKILDLGLALLAEPQSPGEITDTGQVMGTVDYMAPEQVADAHRVDARADIYALGATLFKLLTGQVVFHGTQYGNTLQKLTALTLTPAQTVQSVASHVPAELSSFVALLLDKDPAARPQSAAAVADRLESWAAGNNLAGLLQRAVEAGCCPPEALGGLHGSGAAPFIPSWKPVKFVRTPGASSSRITRTALGNNQRVQPWKWLTAGAAAALLLVAALMVWRGYERSNSVSGLTAGDIKFYQVTGSPVGIVWGDGEYTGDSELAAAAVHAGILKADEQGVIKVTLTPGRTSYPGTFKNGIQTGSWGDYPVSMRIAKATPAELANKSNQVLPAPVNLALPSPRGPRDYFDLIGTASDAVWGTDVYTADSNLGAAAVHAGLLKQGESGQFRVTLLPGRASYPGSNRNGVITSDFAEFPQSIRLEKLTTELVASPAAGPIVEPYVGFGPSDGLMPGMVRYYRVLGVRIGVAWGTDEYTADSDLRTAAVHAGAVEPHDIRIVKVTFVPGKSSYEGTSRNGVTTDRWGNFPLGFRVELADANAAEPTAEKPDTEKPAAEPMK